MRKRLIVRIAYLQQYMWPWATTGCFSEFPNIQIETETNII